MAVKKNMNEKKTKDKRQGKWLISIILDTPKEAYMLSQAERLPTPDNDFNQYPAIIIMPTSFTLFAVLKKAYTISKMGLVSRIYKA